MALYRSGQRLRAVVGHTPGGARTFLGWYDSQNEQRCDFLPTADGERRCLPRGGETTAFYFGDPECTEILLMTYPIDPDCGDYDAIRLVEFTPCGPEYRSFALGQRYPDDTAWRAESEGCLPLGITLLRERHEFYRLGAETPLSSFVALQESLLEPE